MNVLLLSSRFPWPAFTGDRLRATIWLSALESEANVALIAPAGRVPAAAPPFCYYPVAKSVIRGASGAMRVLGGSPVQGLLAAPYDWSEAIARARRDFGAFDASIVLLSRLDPAVRELLPDGLRVLDAIDSLRRNAIERSRESSALMRSFWRAETRRVARVEAEAARAYDRVIVVSTEDAAELGAVAISNGVPIAPLESAPRAFDFGFWGRLAYFANTDAATWLIDEIWPAIRSRRPEATLLIGGADVPPAIRAAHGRDGITVQSPFADIAALSRSVKVALFPMRFGTGQSTKVLEAAEGGCAIVATTKAMRGLDALTTHALVSDDAAGLAAAALSSISSDETRLAVASALRQAVAASYPREDTYDRLAAIVHRREAAA